MLHLSVFDYGAYVFFPSKVHANKLVLYSKVMIFIGYKGNGYCFMCYTQGNIIFHSIHAIFDKKIFPKYTDSHAKKHKLYNKLLNKISSKIELSVFDPSRKDRPAPVSILHMSISLFKTILLLILLYPLIFISFHLPHLLQSLKSLLKRMIMLTLILRCNFSALNNPCDLLYRYCKKVSS